LKALGFARNFACLMVLVALGHAAGVVTQTSRKFSPSGGGSPPAGCEFYIGPSGSNSNDGLTTGTPWRIDGLNSKGGTYGGTVVCLLDGTYDLTNVGGTNLMDAAGASYSAAAVTVAGGTSGDPTVLRAVNPRQAILDGKGSSGFYGGYSGSGHAQRALMRVTQAHVTIDGIKFTGAATGYLKMGIFNDVPGAWGTIQGWTVQNNWFDDQVCQFPDGYIDNCYSLEIQNSLDAVARNNKFTNSRGRSTTSDDHMSAILVWLASGTVLEYNTAIGSSDFYGKEYYNHGTIIRYNYIAPNKNDGNGVFDFNGGNKSTYTGQTRPTEVYNNVIVAAATGILLMSTNGSGTTRFPWVTPVKVYNNTIVVTATTNPHFYVCLDSTMNGQLEYYNNIYAGTFSVDRKAVSLNALSLGKSGYNVMPNSGSRWRLVSDANCGPDNGPGDYTAIGTYRTAVQTQGGLSSSLVEVGTTETAQGTSSLFTLTGTDAAQYQLKAGSAAINAGRSDGTSGGSVVDAGAWGNLPVGVTRIGTDF